MSRSWLSIPCAVCALLVPSAGHAQHTPIEKQPPCEAYGQSVAVFTGVAGAPVERRVDLPNHPPLAMTLTPVTVERAYTGVRTPIVYLTPLGVPHYPTPGRRYLVYGRAYHQPDIVMASPGFGAKEIEAADPDIAFLESLAPGSRGGIISGVAQLEDVAYDGSIRSVTPLNSILVRIFNNAHSTEVTTTAAGRFSSAVPAGKYQLLAELPDDLVVRDATSRIQTIVGDAGCAVVTIDAVFNGRVRGVLRGPDGRPLRSTSVDLMPVDIEAEPTRGHIRGTGSVATNDKGEFEFRGRPSGRYYLGVSLYNAPNPYGPSYPRTYYPGTVDRAAALPVVVERGRRSDGFDFSVPTILPKGELEVIVESGQPGELKLCYVQLEDLVSRRSTYTPQPGVPLRLPVVDGQRYEVHAHVVFSGGHLESEPFVFRATTAKMVIRLYPDTPRTLHR